MLKKGDSVYIECRIVPIINENMEAEQYPIAKLKGTILIGPMTSISKNLSIDNCCIVKFESINHLQAISVENIKQETFE